MHGDQSQVVLHQITASSLMVFSGLLEQEHLGVIFLMILANGLQFIDNSALTMLHFAADENFNGRIVRGLQRKLPELDIVRVQDTSLAAASDPEILEWAAGEGRVLLTHDVSTVTRFANDRVRAALPMPGVVEVSTRMPIGQAIDEIELLALASLPGECEGQVMYLPLRSGGSRDRSR